MADVDQATARKLLEDTLATVETECMQSIAPKAQDKIVEAYERVFGSRTQAYREVLLGCIIARLVNPAVDVRFPYVDLDKNAYSGRTLDERVINPFLREHRIPCSKGPFLAVFRRKVTFQAATRDGLSDKDGYDAMLTILEAVAPGSRKLLMGLLRYHLWAFLKLRDASGICLIWLRRVSLEQIDCLISQLLKVPSGGRFPVFLAMAAFEALHAHFSLDWTVQSQGINVADKAAGATGDITIRDGQRIVLAVEVTERPVDKERCISTFDTKIAPNSVDDYLFLVGTTQQDEGALQQARKYFAQGHDVNFLDVESWITRVMSLTGPDGRSVFIRQMITYLDCLDVPARLKMAWNDTLAKIAAGEL
jgi:hypothetical protein